MANSRFPLNADVDMNGTGDLPAEVSESLMSEGATEFIPAVDLDMDDAVLAQQIQDDIQNGMTLHNRMKRVQDINEQYWLGHHTKGMSTPGRIAPIENRIFISAETIIPIITSKTPEPVVFLPPELKEFGELLQKVLIGKYEDDNEKVEFAIAVRHWWLYKVGVLKLVYNAQTNDFKTEHVRPQRLIFDPRGRTEDECRYIAEYVEDTMTELIAKFPNKEKEIRAYGFEKHGGEIREDAIMGYWEYWTNENLIFRMDSLILDKGKNPLFDFEFQQNNYLLNPSKPYTLINRILSLGKSVYDDSSMVEQVKAMQDAINRLLKNVMDDLQDRGTIAATSDFISKDELSKYRGGTDDKLFGDGGGGKDIRAMMIRIPPKDINPNAMELKREMSLQSDSTMGTHATTRGERTGAETFRGRQLLKEGDTGRTEPVSDALDRAVTRATNLQIQAMKLYWDEEKYIPYSDNKGLATLVKFKGSDIVQGVRVRIKPGSLLPKDKFVERNEALELSGQNRIDDETLYEKLGWANPGEAAEKLFLQKAVESGNLFQPGFLDAAELLHPGIKQKVVERLQQVGASPVIIQGIVMGPQPMMPPGGAPGMPGAAPPSGPPGQINSGEVDVSQRPDPAAIAAQMANDAQNVPGL